MSVVERADDTITHGVLLVAGLVAGGLAAFYIDGIPRYALPAVGLLVLAIVASLERRD